MNRLIINCETGEAEEVPLTAAEIKQREADAAAQAALPPPPPPLEQRFEEFITAVEGAASLASIKAAAAKARRR